MTRKTKSPIAPEQTVSAALAAILQHNVTALQRWQTQARDGHEIEGVHQMRVALRRMRSALVLFRDLLPSTPWQEELRWIAGELGPARDLDVFITETLAPVAAALDLPGAAALHARAAQRRARAYAEQVVPVLDSERYARLNAELPRWIATCGWEHEVTEKQRRLLHGPLLGHARHLLERQMSRVLTVGVEVRREDAAALHRLRIQCKKLRYATEFFAPLFPGMAEFVAQLKQLQDILGALNDVAVARHLLDDLLAAEAEPEVWLFAGAVLGWRSQHAQQLLEHFTAAWRELTLAPRPWWLDRSENAE